MRLPPFFWFPFVWYPLRFVALVSYCLVLLVCLKQTSILSISPLHLRIRPGLSESFALSDFLFPILFRELLRNRNSSLALFLFSSVTLLEVVLLFWVSISLLRPFINLFALILSSSVIFMAVSLMFSLTFFHLVCGFCPLLLCTVISSMLSHRHSLVVYSDIHLSKDLSIFSDISLNFLFLITSSGSLHSPFPQYGRFFAIIFLNTGSWSLISCPMPTSLL